ncbi:GNAT family N-acetyltransferase [Streptomyces sp. HNM0574]|uniref:GNAT family N-acetyltransferase n=1 Tax=Streptomyces sp. HNM0574 TaxID=2714954 RepID=UPI00146CEF93|nr:GNAT family N-acetyltransferase [Streptomyces sp. HNM0574]NLU70995.1 N-acetyltransferase [Streptomyces sp. HNM0574]
MTYLIRAVRAEDWRELKDLRLAALADPAAPVAFTEPYAKAVAQSDEFWRRRAAQGDRGRVAQTFVGEPAGADSAAGVARWAGMVTVLVEKDSVDVVGVYVRPEHRGTGLAGQLFAAAEEWARPLRRIGVRRMRLHVHEDNPRAEALYRRLGYVRTGEADADPKNPALNQYEMELRFDP